MYWSRFARAWLDIAQAHRLVSLGLEHVAGCTWRGTPTR